MKREKQIRGPDLSQQRLWTDRARLREEGCSEKGMRGGVKRGANLRAEFAFVSIEFCLFLKKSIELKKKINSIFYFLNIVLCW